MTVKIQLESKNFYLPILSFLKTSTNLTELRNKLNISKQNLNFYLRQLKKRGLIEQKGRGWYEPVKRVKISTKYSSLLVKDSIRGHAYVWTIKLPKEIKGWDRRISILKEKDVHFKLVGAKLDVPRIKVLGRKIWLCKDHLRVFDKKDYSYYGNTAKESKKMALNEILLITAALEKKLGIIFNIKDVYFKKEHYSLIKNDLAIEHNKKGEILHVSDNNEEWLLVDDSLEKGGELETIGKGAYKTNLSLQKWWNDQKKHDFEVTPSFILNSFHSLTSNQVMFDKNIQTHLNVLREIGLRVDELGKAVQKLTKVVGKAQSSGKV